MSLEAVGYARTDAEGNSSASVQAFTERDTADLGADAINGPIGEPRARLEGIEKVTGRARYTHDLRLGGQLEGAVLRSPHPHARVLDIDTSRAEALEGVFAVLSMKDDIPTRWYGEEVPVFGERLRFVGDEVAAVAATTLDIAEEALRLIDVRYEVLPHVTDMARALDDGAPALYEGGNLQEPETYSRGDADAAFESAEVKVDDVWHTQCALHQALEVHGTVAEWRGDELVLHESTQGVHAIRESMAEKLGLPLARVRVVCEHMGGGFGAKQKPWKQSLFAALLARRTNRPVRLMLDRRGESLATGNRPATRQHVRLGANADGTLTSISVDVLSTPGAYSSPGEASDVAGIFQYLYACRNVATVTRRVYTNAGPSVAFRAPGYVEGCFALESAMDELAAKLGMDPFELRLKNYSPRDQVQDLPWSSPDGVKTCLERLDAAFGWREGSKSRSAAGSDDRRSADGAASRPNVVRGRGLAVHEWMAGFGFPPGYARVVVQTDGSVELMTGTQDIGTGTRTVLTQVAADVLGVGLDGVVMRLGDTAAGLYAPTSSGSATVPTVAPVVRAAALDARRQLLEAAGRLLQTTPDTLTLHDGHVGDASTGERRMTLEALAGEIAPHTVQGSATRLSNPQGTTIRPFGAQAAEVEVDLDSGEVRVLRVVSAPDCGRVLNARTATSQVLGGVTQGIGFALTEERIMDHDLGVVLNANLEDYLVPTSADTPPILHALVDVPDFNANHLGSKGMGELPMIPAAPAILNAVHDAIGVRLRTLPLTRATVLEALARRQASKENRA